MKKRKIFFISLAIALLPVIYLCFIYNGLPERIPTHWGISSKPDAFGSRQTIIALPAIFLFLTIGIVLLILNIDKLDPKKGKNMSPVLINKLAISLALFMAAITTYILYITQSPTHEMGSFLFFIIGIFFAFLGNIMYSVKQNFFVGARLPWTLSNEENWNKTNRLMSTFFFISGIIIAIASLILPSMVLIIITLVSVLGSTIYCGIYSYRLFKKQQSISK